MRLAVVIVRRRLTCGLEIFDLLVGQFSSELYIWHLIYLCKKSIESNLIEFTSVSKLNLFQSGETCQPPSRWVWAERC